MDKIYINSVNKHITMEEFNNYTQKVGKAYKINKNYFQKCIDYDEYGRPIVESITILNNVGGNYRLTIYANDLPKPSLDFVNDVMDGSIVEIDSNVYDKLASEIKRTASMLEDLSLKF